MDNYDNLFDLNKSFNLYKEEIPSLIEYFKKKSGWIYVSHSKINDVNGVAKYLKIGRTSKGSWERAKSLSQTGVSSPYEALFSLKFYNQYLAEKNIANRLKKFRGNKEFYYVDLNQAVEEIQNEYQRQEKALNRYFDFNAVKEDYDTLEFYLKS